MYNRPIPGQSLTATPRNSSYEQPPVIVDPKIAVQTHLKRLTKPKAMEDILLFIDAGVEEAIYKMPETVEETKKEMPEKSSGLMARK